MCPACATTSDVRAIARNVVRIAMAFLETGTLWLWIAGLRQEARRGMTALQK
jgi:hypothetical protein